MSSVLLWSAAAPIKGWRVEPLPGERETDGRGWLLQALRLHSAGDFDGLWKLLDQTLPGGRQVVVELAEGLLELHASLARARGCEELFAAEKAQGYTLLLPAVEFHIERALAELGPTVKCWETCELIELHWPCGSVLRFERGRSGIFWRDATSDLVAEIEQAAAEVVSAGPSAGVALAGSSSASADGPAPPNEEPALPGPLATPRVETDEPATEAAPEPGASPAAATHAQPAGPAPIHDPELPDPAIAAHETLRQARVELAGKFAEKGREFHAISGRCVLCAGGIEGTQTVVELANESEGDRALAHLSCVRQLRAAPPPPPAPDVGAAAAELRRLHVLARARAAAEQALATSEHRTFWETLAESPAYRMGGQWMCVGCGLGVAGEEARVRAPGPDGVRHAIHFGCATKALETERTVYGTRAEMLAWLVERGVRCAAARRTGALEAACLAYRRMQDVLSIEWEKKTVRTARRKASDCCLCGGAIAIGMRYVDGAKGRAAHLPCAGVSDPEKSEAAA